MKMAVQNSELISRLRLYNIASININTISNQTKLDALKNFLNLMDIDIALLQEVGDMDFSIAGYNCINNVDERKRGTSIAIKPHIPVSHIEKSPNGRIIKIVANNVITICNIYAPSGSNNKSMRENFYNFEIPYFFKNLTEYTILGGDFNATINKKDSSGQNSSISFALQNFVHSLKLIDSWEVKNGDKSGSTFQRANCHSRIDRIYLSKNQSQNLSYTKIQTNSFSDHHAYITGINFPNMGKKFGKGLWKLNPNVLTDEIIFEFSKKWS